MENNTREHNEHLGGRMRTVTNADRKYNIEKERLRLRKKQSLLGRGKTAYRRVRGKYSAWVGARGKAGEGPAPRLRTAAVQAVACVAIFGLLLGARYLPFAASRQFVETVKTVATTSVSDQSMGEALGKLKFVSNLVPQSVLVFWNRSGAAPDALGLPLGDGQLALRDEDKAVWFLGNGVVKAVADGKITAVQRSSYGGYCATIEHDGGLVSRYEPLVGVRNVPGDEVFEGQSFAVPVEEEGVAKIKVGLELGGEAIEVAPYYEAE